ncbi:MAG: HAD-IA family hydrolase [Nitrospinae bacterium]|nr:HAD-IA family hydrolase [Nitrospinota bacterium]
MGNAHLAIRALLLDHDGTLVDSYEGIAKCMRLMCRDMGVPEMSDAQILASIGPTLEERFTQLWGEDMAEEAVAIYRSHYKVHNVAGTHIIPGVKKTLETLAGRGIQMACVSNKAWFFCKEQLEHVGLLPYIREVFGHRQGYAPKPDPEMLFAAIKSLEVKPEEVVMVGDTTTDLQAARNASIPAWIIKGKYSQHNEIIKLNPDRYLEKLEDVLDLI